eukprot:354687-Chlamydomonas_euryale.AAC.3
MGWPKTARSGVPFETAPSPLCWILPVLLRSTQACPCGSAPCNSDSDNHRVGTAHVSIKMKASVTQTRFIAL